jgi:hypothetical protein
LKCIQIRKYTNFEKNSDLEFVQNRNCLEHEKPEKPAKLVNQRKRKPLRIRKKEETKTKGPSANGPQPISLHSQVVYGRPGETLISSFFDDTAYERMQIAEMARA